MKRISPLLCTLLLLSAPVWQPRLHANSASWNVLADGDWSDPANWSPSNTYPGEGTADNQIATFTQNSGTNPISMIVELDVNVTLGGLTIAGGASRSYTIESGSGKIITLRNTTGTAPLNFNGGGGNGRMVDVGITLDTDVVTISGRTAHFLKSLTAANGRDITINFSGSFAFDQSKPNDMFSFEANNQFGAGTINLASSAGLQFDHAGAGGGSATTIHFTDPANRTVLSLNVSGAANFGNRLEVDDEALGKVYLRQTGIANSSAFGGIKVGESGSLELTSRGHGYVNTAGSVRIASGGVLLTQGDYSNANASMTLTLKENAILGGEGTIATAANGTAPNRAVILESGAILAPGNPDVEGATGILSVGNATYDQSQLTLLGGARVRFDLAGLTAGDEHDQIHVVGTGALSLDGAIAEFNLLTMSYTAGDEVVLVRFDAGATRVGTFAGLAEGALVSFGTLGSAEISYLGGDGNDIALVNFQLIPEPGALALLGFGLVIAARYGRRRRKG